MPKGIEIVLMQPKEGGEESMMAMRDRLVGALHEHLEGLLETMCVKMDDGSVVDILIWETREHIDSAPLGSPIPELDEWKTYIEKPVILKGTLVSP